ncbi:PREDICTED: probable calcium-binding protein CML49 isoform X2 [Nelumbo nucifera]|uniref:Probable calcium-binding protein CML49 isoform X2 n=1 Tax=Nelumbo nucifera TaxID=4432 RepID=A0A1U8BQK7_NELNU|nr:PREDICTED: probable calcium-binding protein CML49 isoform X2 [Nelumbo nucifera]
MTLTSLGSQKQKYKTRESMTGYPPGYPVPGYGYGAPPAQPYETATPYGAPPAQPYAAPSAPYAPGHTPGDKPSKDKHKHKPHGSGSSSSDAPPPYSAYQLSSAPPTSGYPPASAPSLSGYQPYGSPFVSLVPSAFPPGTDPNIVACFQAADQDGSGFIDDRELQGALSSYHQSFSIRTVRLFMYLFTNSNTRKIGPKEFISVFYSLQNWRSNFERFDRDRSGKIDASELREALLSLGFAVSPTVLDLLVSKFDKSGGKNKAIEYDHFIEGSRRSSKRWINHTMVQQHSRMIISC